MRGLALLVAWLAWAGPARGQHVLKIATTAPEGTGWAHAIHSFTAEVRQATRGQLDMKWYFGGIAGDEFEARQRMERGQLDGIGAGALCEQVMPTMRVLGLPAVFQDREESYFVVNQLRSDLQAEARQAGYELLGVAGLGPDVIFSRVAIRTLDELKRSRLWAWNVDMAAIAGLRAMGQLIVPMRIEDAAAAFDAGKLDGFHAIPAAALAFQWATRAHFVVDLRVRFLSGCVLIAARSFDRLPYEQQQVLRTAGAQLARRFEAVGRDMDAQLLGGLFAKQGLTVLEPSETLHSEFFAAARRVRADMLRAVDLKPERLERVQSLLADYRAEHPHR